MQLGVIGLGRMGGNIVRRLARAGHSCVVFDQDATTVRALTGKGVEGAASLQNLVGQLTKPRAIWVMLPAGDVTGATIGQLAPLLERGDAIIDGGNTFYKDDIARAKSLQPAGIDYIDCGTSGGVWGLERGYCLMIGGDKAAIDRLNPIFDSLAPGKGAIATTDGRDGRDPHVERGYMHCGPAGAGHFVKMIHNGVEYGLMQAYAEGFNLLRGAASEQLPQHQRYQFDVADIAELWRRGSVVSSWLLDLTATALAEDPALSGYSGHVEDSGEGRWTIQAAIEQAAPAPVLTAALYARFRSRDKIGFSDKILSAMRKKFGGHVEKRSLSFVASRDAVT